MNINNLRTHTEYSDLASSISKLKLSDDEPLLFSPANGNWGDALINFGTRQFFSMNGFRWDEVSKYHHGEAMSSGQYLDRLVIMGGGGSWSRNGFLTKQITKTVAEQARHVVVLPTTYDLPAVEADNVTYFARDHVNSLKYVPQATFCHDMAFYTELVVSPVENRTWRLFAMRDDNEGHGHGKHFPQNIDISRLGDGTYRFVDPFFNIPNNFKVVTTDRMHVGIASAMLGLQVNLISGNYPKTVDVFESSIKGNFPRVRMRTIDDILAWYGKR